MSSVVGAGGWRREESGEDWLPRGDHEEGDRPLTFCGVDLVNYLAVL